MAHSSRLVSESPGRGDHRHGDYQRCTHLTYLGNLQNLQFQCQEQQHYAVYAGRYGEWQHLVQNLSKEGEAYYYEQLYNVAHSL